MARARQKLCLEAAEAIAAKALAFLVADPARLSRFLALTGLSADDLRRRIDTPEILSAALDHLARDEPLLLVFAASAPMAPEAVGEALSVLQKGHRRA